MKSSFPYTSLHAQSLLSLNPFIQSVEKQGNLLVIEFNENFLSFDEISALLVQAELGNPNLT